MRHTSVLLVNALQRLRMPRDDVSTPGEPSEMPREFTSTVFDLCLILTTLLQVTLSEISWTSTPAGEARHGFTARAFVDGSGTLPFPPTCAVNPRM